MGGGQTPGGPERGLATGLAGLGPCRHGALAWPGKSLEAPSLFPETVAGRGHGRWSGQAQQRPGSGLPSTLWFIHTTPLTYLWGSC